MKKRKIIFNITLFVLPILVMLLVISFHSRELIKFGMQIILSILILVALGIIINNIIFHKKEKKQIKRKPNYIFLSVLAVYLLGCFSFLFILYGPINNFRNWLITTAMGTMNHQYLCKWFYNDDEIKKVMAEDYILESGESTDADLIDFNFPEGFKDKYEEQLFKNKKEDEIYRIIRFEVNNCDAFLAAVYDPSKVSVVLSNKFPDVGQYVTKLAEMNKAPLAINGGGFIDPNHSSLGGLPFGVAISNKKIYTGKNEKNNIIGLNNDHKLVLLKNKTAEEALAMGVRDAVTHSPFLIVNGESSYIKGSGGWGYAARTAIGQRKDGTILFLVVDSNALRTKGASMHDLAKIMMNYGAINAANLDGGTSSVMVENYNIINKPIDSTLSNKTRPIATAFLVKE